MFEVAQEYFIIIIDLLMINNINLIYVVFFAVNIFLVFFSFDVFSMS